MTSSSGLAAGARAARVELLHAAADHQVDDRRGPWPAPSRRRRRPRRLAVAQHGEAIGDALRLLDEVRDVDDGVPCARRRAMSANSASASAWARLLVGSSRTSTRQPTATARAISTICCAAIGSVPATTVAAGCCGWCSSASARAARSRMRGAIEQAPRHRARRLDAEQDVLGDGQVRRQRQLLVDHRHARAARVQRLGRRVRPRRRASSPRVGLQRAREDLHERALAGAVLAEQRVHLARARPTGRRRPAPAWRRSASSRRASRARGRGRCYSFSHFLKSGLSSACASGVPIVARVISVAPVSIRLSTGRPARWSTIALTAR